MGLIQELNTATNAGQSMPNKARVPDDRGQPGSTLIVRNRFPLLVLLTFITTLLLHGQQGHAQVTLTGTQIHIASGLVSAPAGVAVDGQGNIYIADTGNNRILCVTQVNGQLGQPQVILGGLSSPKGMISDWSGNLYIADSGNNQIVMLPVTAQGHGDPIYMASGLNNPSGVAIDAAGNVYVADTGNNRIVELRQVNQSYQAPIVLTDGLSNPTGIAIDAASTLYIADTGNNRIIKEPLTVGGYLTQQIIRRGLNAPTDVAVDSASDVFIAAAGDGSVLEEPWFPFAKRYKSEVNIGSSYASPQALAPDWKGNVFVADSASNQVLEIVQGSVNFGSYSIGVSAPVQTYSFNITAGTAVGGYSVMMQGAPGRDFVDAGHSTCLPQTYQYTSTCGIDVTFTPLASGARLGAVSIYDMQGNVLATAFLSGTGLGTRTAFIPGTRTQIGAQLSAPAGVAVDGAGNVYISDSGNNRVVEIPVTALGYGLQTTLPVAGLNNPMGITIDGAGDIFIVSSGNDKVLELQWNGATYGTQQRLPNSFYGPTGVAVDAGGSVFVSDTLDNYIWKLPWAGSNFGVAKPLGNYHRCPTGIAADGNGNIFASSPFQDQVIMVPWSGTGYLNQLPIALAAGSFPSALAVDGASNLYILDTANNQVLMLPWTGSGFGSQVTVAGGFNAPLGMTIDSPGNLYVADTGNNQVVKIDMSTPPSLSFANTYLGSKSTDSPKTILVENLGNQPHVTESVVYPGEFSEENGTTNPCAPGVLVSPGTACELAVDFIPGISSALINESVSITFSSLGTIEPTEAVNLSGSSLGKMMQAITFTPPTSTVYGSGDIALLAQASSGLAVSFQVISGPGSISSNSAYLKISGAGTVVIEAFQSGNASYESATPVVASIYIAPAVLNVTPINVVAAYGDTLPPLGYSIAGFVLGDTVANSVVGSADVQGPKGGVQGAGDYVLSALIGTLQAANYTFTFGTGILSVKRAQLVISAGSSSITYGVVPPEMTWTASGFVNGEDSRVIHGSPGFATALEMPLQVGSYVVMPTQGTLLSSNYMFVFKSGVVKVLPATLTVVADSQTMIYGGAVPPLTYSMSGFVGGDSVSVAVSGSPVIAAMVKSSIPTGKYAVKIAMGSLVAHNYSIRLVEGVLMVTKAVITVTPDDVQMTYGSRVPTLKYSLAGLVNGDSQAVSVSGAPAIYAAIGSNPLPGVSLIVATMGSLSSRNYSFAFSTGVLTVVKAVLSVRPVDVSMVYGEDVPRFSYRISGFVHGDSGGVVSGSPTITSSVVKGSPVGAYVLDLEIGSLSAANYTFAPATGVIAVKRAVLKVVPDDLSMTYGSAVPPLTYSMSGLVGGDSVESISGSPILITSASASARAGKYAVSCSPGSLSSTNYSVVCGTGNLTVNKAVLTVRACSFGMTYGDRLPGLKYEFSGFVNGDDARSIGGSAVLRPGFPVRSGAGVYLLEIMQGSLRSSNYSFSLQPGRIVVNKAMLTVTPMPASSVYGALPPALSYRVSGFVNGDDVSDLRGVANVTTVATSQSPVGAYPVVSDVGSLWSPNYKFKFGTSVLTVNPAVITVRPVAVSMVYGQALPPISGSYKGFVNGEGPEVISGEASYTTEASATAGVGTYRLRVSVAGLHASNYVFVGEDSLVTVSKAVLTVTAQSVLMRVGSAVPVLSYSLSGLRNGDIASSVTTGTASVSTIAKATSPAGSYGIVTGRGSLQSGNYTFAFVDGKLTVTP